MEGVSHTVQKGAVVEGIGIDSVRHCHASKGRDRTGWSKIVASYNACSG